MNDLTPPSKKPDTLNVSLNIGYKTIVLGIVITLAINVSTYFLSQVFGFELQFRDYIALFSAGIVTTALIYTAIGLKINYNVNMQKLAFDKKKFEYEKNRYDETLKRKRREFAYQISSDWFHDGMSTCVQKARAFVKPHKDKLNSYAEVKAFDEELDKDLEVRKSLLSVLNYFEYVSILILDNVIDENAIKDAFKTVFCDYYKTLQGFIEYHQKESQRYYSHYVKIAKSWITD